ncbi:TMEM100 [Cervus elaphus hippelaphus]|uniref:TMEM100 n=1 Tax=Cervus elaphus hippelaphus TaxID=46360 RepID=A0A212DAK0_CEREH|nr:TMEM100 [Cervus elaphus hippelaphus]
MCYPPLIPLHAAPRTTRGQAALDCLRDLGDAAVTMTDEPVKEILGTPKSPKPVAMEKNANGEVVVTMVPLVSEIQLAAATGGAELSCYRCVIPFAVVVLITGTVVTAVAYSFNSHGSIISILGLVLLSLGLFLLASSALCWKNNSSSSALPYWMCQVQHLATEVEQMPSLPLTILTHRQTMIKKAW